MILHRLCQLGVLTVVACVLEGCSSPSTAPVYSGSVGDQIRIVRLQTWFSSLVHERWDGPLIDNARMRFLYARSEENRDAITTIILSSNTDAKEKRIGVLLMQCLPEDQYLDFVRRIADEVRRGSVDAAILSQALYPGAEWGSVIVENYENKQVSEFLTGIEHEGLGGIEVRHQVDWILSGEGAAYIVHLRNTNSEVPVISCAEPSHASLRD